MAIRKETTGTEELIRDNRYHRAALLADPDTAHLAPATKPTEDALRKAAHAHDDKEGERAEKLAVLVRYDYLLDTRLKYLESDVYGECGRSRADDRYKEILPHGLAAVIALRGKPEEDAVDALLKKLEQHFPALAKKYDKDLKRLAAQATQAEKDWDAAETAADHAMLDVFAARRALVRQLQKNEGALLTLFPGEIPRPQLLPLTEAPPRRGAERRRRRRHPERLIPGTPIRLHPHLLALLLAPACANNVPAIPTDLAQTADLAQSVDLAPPRDFSDQEYIADIDGGRLMGGDCLARPLEPCDPADGGMLDRDPAARHLSALLEACGDPMLPVCSVLRVQYDKDGCATRVEYYGDNRAFPVIRCTTAKLDRTRSACAFDRTVTVVGFCE